MLKFSVILCCFVLSVYSASDSLPLTSTPAGSILGSWMETRKGRSIEAYRGIRYAEPPIETLRFQPPVLITNYTSQVNATVEGPGCPQPVSNPNGSFFVDEDCLRLNVYTPANRSSSLLPVIVYLHPGGFYTGTGRSDFAGPLYLLEHDVVLVGVNYRLASLGFMSTGDKYAPGNNGFKDQTIALRWIKQNIESFGGDPNNVVLTGYSAGSLSIGLHIVSPMSQGLFHKAISMSASPYSQVVYESDQRYLAVRQANLLGCPSNTTEEMMECFQNKTYEEFGNSLYGMFEFGYDPVLLWTAVIEPDFGQERFLPEHPLTLLKSGNINHVPYIITQTHDEFFWKAYDVLNNATMTEQFNSEYHRIAPIAFMLPNRTSTVEPDRLKEFYLGGNDLTNTTEVADGLGKAYSDAVIGFAVHRLAQLMCRYNTKPVYYGQFAYIGNNSHYISPETGKPTGTAHHDDLIYLLSLPGAFPIIELGTEDNKIVELMTEMWYNFATQGNPNALNASLPWPVLTPGSPQKWLQINSTLIIKEENMFEDRFNLWDELYPIEY